MMLYANLPATPVFGLRREIDRLFDETFGRNGAGHDWTPAVDVRETEKDFTFALELPGVAPGQVEVTADKGVLTVKGEKKTEDGQEGDRWHMSERTRGTFQRSFQLPPTVADSGIEAQFSNGLLTIRVPKAELPQPKKIQITSR